MAGDGGVISHQYSVGTARVVYMYIFAVNIIRRKALGAAFMSVIMYNIRVKTIELVKPFYFYF